MTRRDIEWTIACVWLLCLFMLGFLAAVEASPSFGILNGCEAYPVECAAYAAERGR